MATRKTTRRKAPVRKRSDEQTGRLLKFHEFETLTGRTIRVTPWKRKHFLEMLDRVKTLFGGMDPTDADTDTVAQLLQRHEELETMGRLTLGMDEDEFDEVFEYEEDFLELIAGLWKVCIQPLVGKNLAGVMAGEVPPAINSPSPN